MQIVEDNAETGRMLHPFPPEKRSVLQGDDDGEMADSEAQPTDYRGCNIRGGTHNHPSDEDARQGDKHNHPAHGETNAKNA